ncbi:histidine phosphatase family protein [Aestuariirhabdus sp. Z084]|uniref:histidine phosphatase family protein n=1 Tax=Aestuariirhabdus haliotis TaxID=2918751 RepID=UPI00201B400B|nr:histidine phosphatase family protein [Aestuariirhabdus haliotis]MCL6417427.1 histidine phosphatase family protein [Aestuariirhabdus haliotis]MCL6421371.1 histidine phosphatase family protein [Aestuariirhabdus haliotis]
MVRWKNSYYLMRHGQSEANVAGLIVSDPVRGCNAFGLTREGERQVIDSAARLEKKPSLILCSDFLRTRQTAQLVAAQLELPAPVLEPGLRERYFGCYEGESDDCYQTVWAQDAVQEDHPERKCSKDETHNRVELPQAVLHRGLGILKRLESTVAGEVVLLVSHGDMVQILQTAFAGLPAFQHRQLPHHQTAEIKALVIEDQSSINPELLDAWQRITGLE